MRVALEKLMGERPYQLSIIDIDQDPAFLALYDELVPVLFACNAISNGAEKQLCHYFLDPEKVKEFCNE